MFQRWPHYLCLLYCPEYACLTQNIYKYKALLALFLFFFKFKTEKMIQLLWVPCEIRVKTFFILRVEGPLVSSSAILLALFFPFTVDSIFFSPFTLLESPARTRCCLVSQSPPFTHTYGKLTALTSTHWLQYVCMYVPARQQRVATCDLINATRHFIISLLSF